MGLRKSLRKRTNAFLFNTLLKKVVTNKIRPFSIDRQGIWFKTEYGFSVYSNMKDRILELDVNPVWEQIESSFIMANISKGDLFIDVGANIGYFSILAAHQCNAKVLAVEPIPKTYEMLNMNIKHNNLDELIEPVNIALGNEDGVLRFTASFGPKNHAEYEANNIHSNAPTITVPVITLDKLLQQKKSTINKVDFIKVDVEGFEYRFLLGAAQTLKTFKPMILMEVEEQRLVKFCAKAENIFGFMNDIGYEDYLCMTDDSITRGTSWQQDLSKARNFAFYTSDRKPVY